ncbi:histidine kinase [Crocinitomix sp.]|nr:histidine kinase [Crocinitomix sp.]
MIFSNHWSVVGQSKSIQPNEKRVITQTLDSARSIFDSNPVEAFNYVESAIRLAIKKNYPYELAQSYLTLATFNYKMGEFNSALLHGSRTIETFESFKKWNDLYEAKMVIAQSNFGLNQFSKAYTDFIGASGTAQRIPNQKKELTAKFEAANCLFAQKKYSLAESKYAEIREIAGKSNNVVLVADIDYKLGEIYEETGQQNKANLFYEDALSNAYQSKNNSVLTRDNERKVQSFNKGDLNDDDQSILNSLNTAEDYFQKEKDTTSIVKNSIQKAAYFETQGNLVDATSEMNISFDLSQKTGDLEAQVSSSKKLYDLYLSSNLKSKAASELENYLLLRDSLVKLDMKKNEEQLALRTVENQISVLEQERDLDQQTILLLEREKAFNNSALEQQRVLLYVFGIILLVFIGFSIILYRNSQAKKRANQLLYLKSLRAQMNPHFIFNSLNSVNNFISQSNEREANRYLAKFSKLMRQVLDHSQVEFISLTSEIEVLKLYVDLEFERFKDKFDYEFNVDQSINTESYTIPPMLIQPFIENAIWHGLRYKETKGLLTINFNDKEDWVEIIIRDNGIGRDKSQAIKTPNQKKHQSSGMRNVEDRTKMIETVFKAKINFEIIDLLNGTGTEVIIKLYRNE